MKRNYSIGESYSKIEIQILDNELSCINEEYQMSFVLDNVDDILEELNAIEHYINSGCECSLDFYKNESFSIYKNEKIHFVVHSFCGADYPLKLTHDETIEFMEILKDIKNERL